MEKGFYIKLKTEIATQRIEDIIFRNIIYNGVGENPSLLKGFDKERSVKNIIFDNVIINGMKMKNIDDFITNEYIKNITVK